MNIQIANIHIPPKLDTTLQLKLLMQETSKHIKNHIPVKYITIKHKQHPWINKTFVELAKTRDYYYKLHTLTKSTHLHQYTKYLKTKCQQYAKHLKKTYYYNLINSQQNNPKKLWNIINRHIKNKQTTEINKLTDIDNSKITDIQTITNKLITHFTLTQTNLQQYYINNSKPLANKFNFKHITLEETIILIQTIKTHNNYTNSINPKILHLIQNTFSKHLMQIINCCIDTCHYPTDLKHAIIHPKQKISQNTHITNYRPISNLPNINKILETHLSNQIKTYLHKNNLISSHQHGFRKKHSTTTCTTELLNYIYTQKDAGNYIIITFLDFTKAFDNISHNTLLEKLNLLDFDNAALKLIQSYLTNRTQQVNINTTYSNITQTCAGVPQGSVLGPLLFILYINDIHLQVKHSKVLTYADDTTLITVDKNPLSLIHKVNTDLHNIHLYSKTNSLSINTTKTKYMTPFTNKDMPLNIFLDNTIIEKTTEFKFLGTYIEYQMNFNKHSTHVLNKLSSTSHIINNINSYITIKQLKLIFNAIGLSHIRYNNINY